MKKPIFLLTILCLIIGISNSCKKSAPVTPPPTTPSVTGTFKITKDQGSDNGDTVYYTRTLNSCQISARFVFGTDRSFKLTSSCKNITGTWNYTESTKELVVKDGTGTVVLDGIVEDQTATGFVYDEIAVPFTDDRMTLEKVQ